MIDHAIRHLPVVDGSGKVLGIVSFEDLRAALPMPVSLTRPPDAAARKSATEVRVTDAMTDAPVTVAADAPLQEAVSRMLQHRIGCLPIVDEQGRLDGIVTPDRPAPGPRHRALGRGDLGPGSGRSAQCTGAPVAAAAKRGRLPVAVAAKGGSGVARHRHSIHRRRTGRRGRLALAAPRGRPAGAERSRADRPRRRTTIDRARLGRHRHGPRDRERRSPRSRGSKRRAARGRAPRRTVPLGASGRPDRPGQQRDEACPSSMRGPSVSRKGNRRWCSARGMPPGRASATATPRSSRSRCWSTRPRRA